MIQYPNGFNYTVHQDGTRFLTYPKKDIIVVEHDGEIMKLYAVVNLTGKNRFRLSESRL